MLLDIFPTSIFVHYIPPDRLDNVQSEITNQLPKIKKLLGTPWKDNMTTTFKYSGSNDIDTFELKLLQDEILKCARIYSKELCNNTDYYIGESWINVGKQGAFQFEHTHTDSVMSGVYYYKTNQEDGKISFKNPNPIASSGRGFPYEDSKLQGINLRNAPCMNYIPEIGKLILFPGWLTHNVEPNTTNSERISISFNLIKLNN